MKTTLLSVSSIFIHSWMKFLRFFNHSKYSLLSFFIMYSYIKSVTLGLIPLVSRNLWNDLRIFSSSSLQSQKERKLEVVLFIIVSYKKCYLLKIRSIICQLFFFGRRRLLWMVHRQTINDNLVRESSAAKLKAETTLLGHSDN